MKPIAILLSEKLYKKPTVCLYYLMEKLSPRLRTRKRWTSSKPLVSFNLVTSSEFCPVFLFCPGWEKARSKHCTEYFDVHFLK